MERFAKTVIAAQSAPANTSGDPMDAMARIFYETSESEGEHILTETHLVDVTLIFV